MKGKGISLSVVCRLLVAVLTLGLILCITGCGKQADEEEASSTVEEKVKKLTKAVNKGKADKYLEEAHYVEVDGDDWDDIDWDDDSDDDSDGDDLDGFDLSGFDDGGSSGSGQGLKGSHEDQGYYYMLSYVEGEEVYTKDDLEASDSVFYMMLNGDGTGYWYVVGTKFDLTWEDGTLYIDNDGSIETVTYVMSGDYIIVSDNEESFVFEYAGEPDITG